MSIKLKNDWKATGNNPTARRMADWMNKVSDLFNFASVPSGGTAQPTERGFQIEIDVEGAVPNLPFDIRANQNDSQIEFYATSDGANTTDMAYLNGQELLWADESGVAATGWVYLAALPADGVTTTIYFRLEPVTTLGVGTEADLTSTSAMKWVISTTSAAGPHGTFKQRVIATVENSGGVYTVTQFLRGSQSINPRYTDTESLTKLQAGDFYKTRSLDTQSEDGNGNGSLRLYDFYNPTLLSEIDLEESELSFLIRRRLNLGLAATVPTLQYLSVDGFVNTIIEIINETFPTLLHNDLDGLQGGDPLADPPEYYHLDADQYGQIDPTTGLIDHGLLDGLTDDDHAQYFKRDGRTPSEDNDITAATKITDTTDASFGGVTTGGALNVAGGINAKNMSITDGTNYIVSIGEAKALDVELGDYHHQGVAGWSGTFQVLQNGVTKDVTVSGGIITNVA